MRTPNWKSEEIFKDESFKYVLSFEHDDIDPKDHFVNTCGWSSEEYEPIKNMYWFLAKISAYKGEQCLADVYLGANCYSSKKEVLGQSIDECLGGYAPQMIEECKEEALEALQETIESLKSQLELLEA